MSELDNFSSELVKKYARPETAATAGVPLDDLSKGIVTDALHKVQPSAEPEHKGDIWKPDTPKGIEPADELFYLLTAEVGLPYAAARGILAAAARVGAPAVGKFLTGQAGKGLLRSLPSVMTSGAWQGALAEGVDKVAGKGHDLSESGAAGLGAVVNAITHGVVSPFVNKIVPEVARRAQNYIAQGIPLRTYQIPGASAAATVAGRLKAYSKLLGMTDKDAPALTESLMKSTGSNAQLLNPATLAQARADIKDRLNQHIAGGAWHNINDGAMPKAFDTVLASGMLTPSEEQIVRLHQNQWANTNVLDRVLANSDATGIAAPSAVARAVQSQAAKYGGMTASDAARAAGNPVDIGALAEGAQHFSPQPFSAQKLASAAVTGGGLLGFGELEGLPLIETLGHHPVATAATSTALGAVGGLQNTPGYTNWLLDRAAKDAGPLLAGSNPLIPGYLAARPVGTNELTAMNPVGSANASTPAAPGDLAPVIGSAATKYGLDANLLTRQLHKESGFQNLPANKAGATGIAQFVPSTAKQYGIDPTDVGQSVEGQAHYMSDLSKQFGNSGLALAAYNWGPGNVSKWLKSGADPKKLPDETSDYVRTVSGQPIESWLPNVKRLNITMSPSNAPPNYFLAGAATGAVPDNSLSGSPQ